MNKKYTDKTKEKVVNAYLQGISVTNIVNKFKISRTTVYSWTKQYKKDNLIDMKKYKELRRMHQREKELLLILQNSPFIKATSLDKKIEYIDALFVDKNYNVSMLCEAFRVSKGTYYNRKLRGKNGNKKYQKRRAELLPIIQEIYESSGRIYGAGKITAIMRDRGYITSEHLVATLMHDNNMFSMRNCSKTLYLMNQERKENILKQEFKVSAPNYVWVSDVTYFKFQNKTYYICVILDLYARKVVAHQISLSNSTQLTKRTFKIAYNARHPNNNLLFHSDQGSNYTSRTFMAYLKNLNVQQSFSRKGTPYDNSVCESFFANMKREELYRRNYKNKSEFLQSVHSYINFYNTERPHSLLRYQTPNKFEEMYYYKSKSNISN